MAAPGATAQRAEFTYLAEPFVHAGAHFVVLDFINVDDAGGSLFPMVEQVRRAVGWVYRNADKFGGDPQPALSHRRIRPARISPAAR